MDRRRFLLTPMAGALAASREAWAQQAGKVSRVGLVGLTGSTSMSLPPYQALRRRLAELGWVEGRNLVFESRWAEGQVQSLPKLIDDVVAAKPRVIYVLSSAAAVAAKRANLEIPVVFSHVTDPVASGVVTTLGRHGGNITGVTYSVPETAGKLLQLLRELQPSMRRVGVVWTAGQPGKLPEVEQLAAAGKSLDVQVVRLELRNADDYAKLTKEPRPQNIDGLVVLADPLSINLRAQLVHFAAKERLPAVYQQRPYVDVGGLMSYGIDDAAVGARVADLVDRILRGTAPADIPVEQPTKFELVINLTTAKALGLTIPPSLLARADQLIE
jgi:putative ABC transport system substrate-binding protein